MKSISTFVIAFLIIGFFFLAIPEMGYSGSNGTPMHVVDVPTLSEWGLIAMAGVLGIVGYLVIRRKKVTA
jgi:hypothetical protein